MLQLTGVLLAERVREDGTVLVVGAGGGLELRYLAGVDLGCRFVRVDPSPAMIDEQRNRLTHGETDLLGLDGVTSAAVPRPRRTAGEGAAGRLIGTLEFLDRG